jgi:hypothetical protein
VEIQFKYKEKPADFNFGLVLVDLDLCPIHLGFFIENNFIELTTKGFQVYSKEKFLNWIRIKKKKACYLPLQNSSSINRESIEEIFKGFNLNLNGITCLDPLKKILALSINESLENCDTIFDVLKKIKEINTTQDFYYLGNEFLINFQLKEYTREQVYQYINELK